jgi:hypothetical protein
MLSKRLLPEALEAPVNVTLNLASETPLRAEKAAKDKTPVLTKLDWIVPAVVPEIKDPTLPQVLPPSALYSQSWVVKPVVVRCALRDMERSAFPAIEKAKTALFPLAAVPPAPPTTAKAAVPDVMVERSVPSEASVFTLEPPKAFNSVLVEAVAGTNQLEDPLLPSKYKVPAPKLAV